ncbi:tail protein (endogenous virus) [Clostridium phage phiCTC2B]|uniref:Phage-like element pbsx protein xkdQ n=1 Tax=Clostridium tetani (strain Massachusetts / E88) TaxID=212717 RepID=Q892I0_CLOTE|nr:hypothetical protein [Clostridium tetani]YP_009276946.1 tail protein [Clostridium phage phiCT19406B]YP_009277390.1 tail protein [Clostridium phage phiCTC2B]AAO36615.1 phage-like element pbsx protein xkdQ [Clostridium tetani E88]AJA42806.1 cell wall hydrolase [Clostridium phage phiCT19406B]AJA43002.1 cell wall hydrolase [Clostridium phage phiCTC2B]KGI39102.1 terminase [Clostridium tetani]KGI43671.1 terminase [Clostridium tetani]
MIRIFKNYNGKTTEITEFCKNITISRSIAEVSRKLECTIMYPLNDPYQIKQQIGVATKVLATLDNKEIFKGILIDRSINSDDTLNFTAFDYAFYLTKNKVTYNFSNTTADRAVKQILGEIGVQTGNIASSNIKLRWLIAQKSVYDAIQELYTQVSKQTGKQYFIVMSNTKVNVIEMGSKLTSKIIKPARDVFTGDGNLLSFEYKDSMGNMINRVKVYDDKNKYLSKIENTTDIKTYGILQDNYVKEQDKDPNIVARNMLHGIDKDVSVGVLGDYNYRTGYAVNVQIPYISTLKNALMYITSDTHTWDMETGTFTTQLELSYINKMDTKESDDTLKFDTKMKKQAIREAKKKQRLAKKKVKKNRK